jgi:hypothetical protein
MRTDLEQLKQAALAANHDGETWHRGEEHEGKVEVWSEGAPGRIFSQVATFKRFSYGPGKDWGSVRADFAIAAHPAVVLELIEQLEDAEGIIRKEMPPIAQCPNCYACFDPREIYGGQLGVTVTVYGLHGGGTKHWASAAVADQIIRLREERDFLHAEISRQRGDSVDH